MKKICLEINGKQVEGTVLSARGQLWVHLNGETFVYDPPRRGGRRGGRAGAAKNPGEIVAPMPGKIIKIMVKPGESVSTNQVILVMEAMKMEYTLKAQADGVVNSVSCEPGQQVVLSQLLVKLESV